MSGKSLWNIDTEPALSEARWRRDVVLIIVGWSLASVLAVVLLLTVVKWLFV